MPTKLNSKLDPTKICQDTQNLLSGLRRLIVGQDEAIEQIVNIYQIHSTGINDRNRPLGTFLFLGPTGTGKTRIVEATAECLVRNPRAVIKIDCGEFQHSHEIAKLIGSPPGYLGHRETHPLLSQEALNQYHTDRCKVSLVLFDEIEKASDALWNLLLGILDKATLTLGDNRKVDFSRAFIFMTSNVGAAEMSAILKPKVGFASPHRVEMESGQVRDKTSKKVSNSGIEAARRKFPPEFMNRADKIVVFKPLGLNQLRQVLDVELDMVQQRICNSMGTYAFSFVVTDSAKDYLLKEGTDVRYGARPLKRAIEKMLVCPMSNLIATDQIHGGDVLEVDYNDVDGLMFTKVAEGISLPHTQRPAEMSSSAVAAGGGAATSKVCVVAGADSKNKPTFSKVVVTITEVMGFILDRRYRAVNKDDHKEIFCFSNDVSSSFFRVNDWVRLTYDPETKEVKKARLL